MITISVDQYIYLQPTLLPRMTDTVVDAIACMEIDQIICFDLKQMQPLFLRRCLVRYNQHNIQAVHRGYSIKSTPTGHKIWRWK